MDAPEDGNHTLVNECLDVHGIFWRYLHTHLVRTGQTFYTQIEDEQQLLEVGANHPSSLTRNSGETNNNV